MTPTQIQPQSPTQPKIQPETQATPHQLVAGNPASVGFDANRLAHIATLVQREVDSGMLPGAVALVAKRGKVVMHQAFGVQNPQDPTTSTPMGLDSIFRMYSMTKPIVSVAAMMLVERGQLLLSEPVGKYVEAFEHMQVAHFAGDTMTLAAPQKAPTIQDLLRHTAGLTYGFLGNEPIQALYQQSALRTGKLDSAEFAKTLAAIPLMFEPGTTFEYSHATDVLGLVIEAVSGQRLGDFLQTHILKPLGMVDTAFFAPSDKHHRLAEPFAKDPEGAPLMRLTNPRIPPAMDGGGSGLVGTSQDYAVFLQMLLNGGVYDGQRLLSPHTIRLMTHDHIGTLHQHISQLGGRMLPEGMGFGLGFSVRLAQGMDVIPGDIGSYSWGGIAGTTFWVDPAQELFAILLTQAPNQRHRYYEMWRNVVYAALL